MEKQIPTLYEWAGGRERFEHLTERFYAKVQSDEVLSKIFEHMSSAHAKHVAHFIAEVFGGGTLYTEGDEGSHAKMVQQHMGKMLTEDLRKRWLNLLLETADEIALADDPEFRSAFVGYLEWGSRLAIINSQLPENEVIQQEPMPKWGWGETGGPYMPG